MATQPTQLAIARRRHSMPIGAELEGGGVRIRLWAPALRGTFKVPYSLGCMEKKTPAYALAGFQKEFTTVKALRLTRTASTCALELGLTLFQVVEVIQCMKREHFYKSMTADGNPRIWQDVYHVPWQALTLYVKLTIDEEGRLLISFKEK